MNTATNFTVNKKTRKQNKTKSYLFVFSAKSFFGKQQKNKEWMNCNVSSLSLKWNKDSA